MKHYFAAVHDDCAVGEQSLFHKVGNEYYRYALLFIEAADNLDYFPPALGVEHCGRFVEY